jgi:hypothetical protein
MRNCLPAAAAVQSLCGKHMAPFKRLSYFSSATSLCSGGEKDSKYIL